MATKSSSKSSKTGPILSPEELYVIAGPHAQPVMLSAIISKQYCRRIQQIGKCKLPCRTNEICRTNIPDMLSKLAVANNRAAFLTYLCRETGEKEIDNSNTHQFTYQVGEFGEKSGDTFDWDSILGGSK